MKPLRLSPREREVVGCLGRGLSYAAIARELGITDSTVRHYVERIAAKLPQQTRATPRTRVLLWAGTGGTAA